MAQLDQDSLKSWASSSIMFSGDRVFVERVKGQSSNQYSTSQSSSPNAPSSSPAGSSSSGDTCSLHSWSSGFTCLLHSSIKKQSQEAFQIRLRGERGWRELTVAPSSGTDHPQAEDGGGCHNKEVHLGRGCTQTDLNKGAKLQTVLEERIKAKQKFSQFLDEVTSNVLNRGSLQAFGKPVPPSGLIPTIPNLPEDLKQVVSASLSRSMAQEKTLLTGQKTLEDEISLVSSQKMYLETDIDSVRRDDDPQNPEMKAESSPQLEIDDKTLIPPPPEFCQGFKLRIPVLELCHYFPRYPYRSVSLPRGINIVSDETYPTLKLREGL
ncbi:hypothetical protein CRENBAI_004328 [Crenichthys baileyi]|uniref:Uncharacterized protein n=1 Tax=Crenichthys baileyi TaxID=28760 RepID=A0AAV9R501_9TELE